MNPRFLVPLGVFAALVVVLAVGINHSHEVGVLQSPLVGHQIPDWELPDAHRSCQEPGLAGAEGPVVCAELLGHVVLCLSRGTQHACCRRSATRACRSSVSTGRMKIPPDALAWLSQLGNPYSAGGDRSDRRHGHRPWSRGCPGILPGQSDGRDRLQGARGHHAGSPGSASSWRACRRNPPRRPRTRVAREDARCALRCIVLVCCARVAPTWAVDPAPLSDPAAAGAL